MIDGLKVYRATIPLSLLQILDLYNIPTYSYIPDFMNLVKIGCVNFAHFPKSGHI